ncbi:phospholipase D-like domain-containing protein [Sphingomonas sp. BK580]|uniref:phospholipase D-like domain-containing protein n=1 Tax=Sphingomonas sp. BK580 TaxID=2586972 RepID=UPI0016119EAE|nr:phospholipase D-like domain-containing protein [Sphingomonas sp. BK580]MBB3693571.1 cardiolipin synthase [Sphingomonas sp. BK580]
MIELRTAVWLMLGAIHVAVVIRAVLLQGREPYARASWLIVLLAAPGAGTALYLLFGEPWISPRVRVRWTKAAEALAPYARPDAIRPVVVRQASENAFRTCEAASGWPTSGGNLARLAPGSDEAIDMIAADIDAAVRTVHLSFYIWLGDRNGSTIVEAVCRAAARGVTCRVVADALGSRALIRSPQWAAMRKAGAILCESLPIPFGLGFVVGRRADLRNHRKIVVVDGRLTWCGSQNCADAAFLPKRRFAPWVDILLRLEGPVARQAEVIFCSAWMAETGEDMTRVFDAEPVRAPTGGFAAISVGTGPLSPRATMSDVFVSVLAAARESAVVTTPYFAPDPPLLEALVATARRGVRVTIVFPRRNDSWMAGAISRAYYPALAGAGVDIHEFEGGLLHAKTLVVDDALVLLGSANMDRRSLDLNYENNVLLESAEVAHAVGRQQQRWLGQSVRLAPNEVAIRPLPQRFVDNLLTMAAPLF